MANEATSSVSLSYSKGGRTEDISFSNVTSDVAGDQYTKTSLVVGTSPVSLSLGGVAALGGLFVGKVISAAGTITFHISGETDFLEYQAGDLISVRFKAGAAVLVKADAADREIEYLILEA